MSFRLLSISILLVPALSCAAARAQPAPATQPAVDATTQPAATQPATDRAEIESAASTPEEIQTWIGRIESSELSDVHKGEATKSLRQGLDFLQAAQSHETRRAEMEKRRGSAPDDLARLREQLAGPASRPTTQPALDVPADAPLEELERRLREAEAAAGEKRDQLRQIDEEIKRREDRLNLIPNLILEANKSRDADLRELDAAPPADAPAMVWEARRFMLRSKREATAAEIRALEEEKRNYEARKDVIAAQRELARIEAVSADARASAWQAVVAERRKAEIEHQERQTQERMEEAPTQVRQYARRNARLIDERAKVARKVEEIQAKRAQVTKTLAQIEGDLEFLKSVIGLSEDDEFVAFLIRKRQEVADLKSAELSLLQHQRERAENEIGLSKLRDELEKNRDLDARVEEVLEYLEKREEIKNPRRFEDAVRSLFEERAKLLELALRDRERYRSELGELTPLEAQLVSRVQEFSAFIEKNILWIPSAKPLHKQEPPPDTGRIAADLYRVATLAWLDIQRYLVIHAIALLAFGVLVVLQRRLARYVRDTAPLASRVLTDRFRFTLGVFGATLLLTLPLPLFLWFISWRLTSPLFLSAEPGVYEMALALSAGLRDAMIVQFSLSLLIQICRPRGLAEVHFRWSPATIRGLRIHLRWFSLIAVIVTFIVTATGEYPDRDFFVRNSVGRGAFLLGMLATSVFFWRMLNPASGVFAKRYTESNRGWFYRLRYFWVLSAAALPVALAVTSYIGYHFTATVFFKRLFITLWLILGTVLVRAMFVRWLVLAQRRLAIEQAQKRRAAEIARRQEQARKEEEKAEAAEAGASTLEELPAPVIDEEEINLVNIGEQTRRLLRTVFIAAFFVGLYFTWEPLMPALSVILDVKISSYTVEVPDGAAGAVREELRYINLGHVVVALLITIVTIVLTRNIPGLLDITVLSRIPIDTGAKFAIKTLSRYAITIIGVVLAFGSVGIGWGQVQWLVAAVTVGLGFGLQEVFANFVSGIILLFERPIRVGDIVTVGNVSGNVTRIRIRATTIMDWDRKELIIPNKEFITGQVINWALTDPTMRISIPISIAQGSDIRLAQKLILDIANAHPRVLKEPAPNVPILEFGVNSLNFQLWVFVESSSMVVSTRNDLLISIDEAFRKAGIHLAAPQREMHVRSISPDVAKALSGLPDDQNSGK